MSQHALEYLGAAAVVAVALVFALPWVGGAIRESRLRRERRAAAAETERSYALDDSLAEMRLRAAISEDIEAIEAPSDLIDACRATFNMGVAEAALVAGGGPR